MQRKRWKILFYDRCIRLMIFKCAESVILHLSFVCSLSPAFSVIRSRRFQFCAAGITHYMILSVNYSWLKAGNLAACYRCDLPAHILFACVDLFCVMYSCIVIHMHHFRDISVNIRYIILPYAVHHFRGCYQVFVFLGILFYAPFTWCVLLFYFIYFCK